LAAKESGERKLPHRLVLAEFLIWLAKIYTLAASWEKILNARQLEIQKRTSQCADIFLKLR
jgi:hypothetical protein